MAHRTRGPYKGDAEYRTSTAQREYARRRRDGIRDGTWNPHRVNEPTIPTTEVDIAWAAGFVEGEGCFHQTKDSVQVSAYQKFTTEPLQKLLSMFGGTLFLNAPGGIKNESCWVWRACGPKARNAIFTLYPYLSQRRTRKILSMITVGDVLDAQV